MPMHWQELPGMVNSRTGIKLQPEANFCTWSLEGIVLVLSTSMLLKMYSVDNATGAVMIVVTGEVTGVVTGVVVTVSLGVVVAAGHLVVGFWSVTKGYGCKLRNGLSLLTVLAGVVYTTM